MTRPLSSSRCDSCPIMRGGRSRVEPTDPTTFSLGPASGKKAEPREGGAELASVTIVIEWDNARRSDVGRSLGMLRALYRQLREIRGSFCARPEIRVLYDGAKIEGAFIERLMSEAIGDEPWPANVVLSPVPGMRYYEQKNRGALCAGTDVILFLDSDVIPEPDWLRRLMESFRDPRVSVVGGGTHVALDDLLGKAFALFWFFPLRDEANELAAADSFFANNVAFRREVFERLPFPDSFVYRGRCSLLAAELRNRGVGIFRHRGARVSHPPPKGLANFVLRALCEGHDEIVLGPSRPDGSSTRVFRSFLEKIVRLPWVVFGRRERVHLGVFGALAGLGIGYSYHSLKLFGGFVAWVHPRGFRRYVSI